MTDRQAGFTLMEVLVALVILAIASAYAFQIVSGGTALLSQATQEQEAVTLAESAVAHLGNDVPVQPGHAISASGIMHMTVDIGSAMTDPPPAQGLAAYPISVDVNWPDAGVTRHFRLHTARLGPEPKSS